ncbi:hypothetical protein BW721_08540 [Jeotgalibaca sp. PTS2502]|uniref:helix-turn-helix domain-containing protein n=1 Tax=Jeotgalibaca sp. PTS2502 TaxID=1903686 RepID=UPI000973B083|nr:helix-turn-helix transcriptional regulator [Jeotgalibaca sp. PTS2502]APZ49702.1 hypothetical protein BW721_08540 [Jeotgalibaca sp. PTS2502]
MEIINKEVGSRIKSIRLNRKETTAEFAKCFDPPASDSLVSRWERGVNLPNTTRLKKIAEIANISVDELLHGKEEEQITMETVIYNGKVKILDEKIGDVVLELESGDYGFMDLLEELKNDDLFEYYDGSGLYILKEVKFIRKEENKVINRFYFNGAN